MCRMRKRKRSSEGKKTNVMKGLDMHTYRYRSQR
jgi:hypothetical protein